MGGAKNESEFPRRIEGLRQRVAELEEALRERDGIREELQEHQLFLQTLIGNAPGAAAMVDTEMRYLSWSKRWLRDYHLGDRDLKGISHYEVFPEIGEDWKAVHRRGLAGVTESREDDHFLRLNGTADCVCWLVQPWRKAGGAVGGLIMLTDVITDRLRAEETSRKSEARYYALVDENPYGVQEIDKDGIIVFSNAAHCEMLGYEEDELIGRSIADFLAPGPQRDELPRYLRTLVKDQPAPTPYFQKNLTKGGEVRDIEVSWNYLRDAEGRLRGFLSVLTDVTERKRQEDEKRALERQLQHAQKLESLGVLAGGIAHDFNNLLTVIRANADLALDALSPMSPARGNLQDIGKASDRAAELASQMLAYSGKGRYVVQPIHIAVLIEEIAHLLEVSISKKAVLKCNFAENLPTFDGDVTQIRQVIMNLITNASEAIGDRSGVISLSTGSMKCDRAYLDDINWVARSGQNEPLPEGVYTYLEVADTGCGMDAETIEKIFDPFFTTKFTGRGMGLSAVLGILRGHKGALEIDSEVGKGTAFKILFLANELPENGFAVTRKDEAEGTDWRGSGTVLIADDVEGVCAVGKLMLERMGFSVLTALDGREALKVFSEHADEITCVLLDLTMPHIGGEEAFQEMRRLRPDVPVILCSGYDEKAATQRLRGKGLAGFIQKPFSMVELREKLMEVLPGERTAPNGKGDMA